MNQNPKPLPNQPKIAQSLLDNMVDGREFESLLSYSFQNLNVIKDIQRSIKEIETARQRPCICYIANVVKPLSSSISIEDADDLPFSELVSTLPPECTKLDVILVTPGGYAHQVAKFVSKLRPRFDEVGFIILNKAMSAGTIFIMSGDEIIMSESSHFGPIDPQIRKNDGQFVPAQSLLTLIKDIQLRGQSALNAGQQPQWTDLQILKSIDPRDIGNALSASNYSIQLVEEYLNAYKFKTWDKHSSSGNPVTEIEKQKRSKEIAELLCDHGKWKNHGHAISRKTAWDVCRLKITNSEDCAGLDKAMRRMWAMLYWVFENTAFAKIFASNQYVLIRQDPKALKGQP